MFTSKFLRITTISARVCTICWTVSNALNFHPISIYVLTTNVIRTGERLSVVEVSKCIQSKKFVSVERVALFSDYAEHPARYRA
jgi:hypothetical protein